ncbi:MAG: hypothetical protein ACUVYA_18905 [Planctomycetota bacterium]
MLKKPAFSEPPAKLRELDRLLLWNLLAVGALVLLVAVCSRL